MPIGRITKIVDIADFNRVFVNVADYESLNVCVASVSGSNQTILIASSTILTGNLIVPPSIELIITKSSLINVDTYNLTVNGRFECGPYQVFTGAGLVTFGQGIVKEIYPDWWEENTTPGTTDMGSALRSAAYSIPNGGIIQLLDKIYYGSTVSHPLNGSYVNVFNLYSNTTLRGMGVGNTVIKLGNNSGNQSAIVRNYNLGSGDSNITIEDITFDGNNTNNLYDRNEGVSFLRVRGVRLNRIVVKNVRGTVGGGNGPGGTVGEGFHIEMGLCTDVYHTDCVVYSNAGSASSGFSADSSTNVFYDNCLARNMSIANGFTVHGCAHVQFSNCRAYSNAGTGFNCENSNRVSYSNCHSGGQASVVGISIELGLGETFPQLYGFVSDFTSTYTSYTNCTATYCTASGFYMDESVSGNNYVACDASYCEIGFNFKSDVGYGGGARKCNMKGCVADNCVLTPLSIQPLPGFSSLKYQLATPPVSSTEIFENKYPFDANVIIYGSTLTLVSVFLYKDGVLIKNLEWLPNEFILPVGHAVQISYDTGGNPVYWEWFSGN